ncbi:DUF7151 family protein [Chitinophaga caseinilytica]|uniref:DUF7151 domain-containing protein n=1 Tax=Chitinophaga caseinilytica TaxID=2267521 RepID=A0ABZ2YY81_9BACT
MKFKKLPFCVSLAGMALFFSCGKDGAAGTNGQDGAISLIDIQPLEPGDQCQNGGLVIKSGIDKNGNKQLEAGEIDQVKNICNGNNGGYDKQIIIPIDKFANSQNNFGYGAGKFIQYVNFDISNYKGVDSVVLFAKVAVGNPGKGIFSLYNFTDKEIIGGSEIESNITYSSTMPYYHSGNCFQHFPKKSIVLGICVQHADGATYAEAEGSFLVLYRK